MSRSSHQWAPYVSVEQRRRNAEREIARRKKAGQVVTPVSIVGRRITSTSWGNAWCANLESYHDYANRIDRGRSYVRNGAVIDLKIAPRTIEALVSGAEIYRVSISISAVAAPKWKSICTDCAGQIDSLVDLLQGRLSASVMERLCRQEEGLFPKPSEIRFKCSCPDHASMCKHIAAVLYGVGVRLDQQPNVLFHLRDVDAASLIAHAGATPPNTGNDPVSSKILRQDDIAGLFGIDLAGGNASNVPVDEQQQPPLVKQSRASHPAERLQATTRQLRSKTVKAKLAQLASGAKPENAPRVAPNKRTGSQRYQEEKPIKWWVPVKKPAKSK
jgi:uncharacterized Zn finger protein